MAKKLILRKLDSYETLPVTTDKLVDRKKFHADGLYSEKIFGPLKDYTCQCGDYDPYGGKCDKCGIQFAKADLRSTKFGHIDLPIEIVNPLFIWDLSSKNKTDKLKFDLSGLIFYRKVLVIMDEIPRIVNIEEFDSVRNMEHYLGTYAIKRLIKWIDDKVEEDPKFKIQTYMKVASYNLFKKYENYLYIDRILVTPPDLRTILFTGNKMIVQENLSRLYTTLLTKINIMKNKTKFVKGANSLTFKNYADIQVICGSVYEEILNVFGSKTGLIRGNILGKRTDYSGRAVISVDPTLKFNECRIPYYILLEVYKYSLAREISKKKQEMIFNVLEEIEESLKMRDYRFLTEVEDFTKDKVVILNRQPTLHKLGLLAWKIKVSTDFTIKIHPWCCTPYNADFDGDSFLGKVSINISTNNTVLTKTFHVEDLLKVEEENGDWVVK